MHQTFPGLCQEDEDEHHFLLPVASPPRPSNLDRSSALLCNIALLSCGQMAGFQSTGPCSAVGQVALSLEDAFQGRHITKPRIQPEILYTTVKVSGVLEKGFSGMKGKKIQHYHRFQ